MNWLKSQINVDLKARMKNYGFWVSMASAVLLALTKAGVRVDDAHVMTIVQAVLGVLVVAGIINNPTTANKGFGDDKVAPTVAPKA